MKKAEKMISRIVPTLLVAAGAAAAQIAPPAPVPAPAPAARPAPVVAPAPPVAPAAVPMPAMPAMPDMPPMPAVAAMDQDRLFELQDKAWEAQVKAMELRDKFQFDDMKFKVDLDHQIAMAADKVANLNFNFAFAPQATIAMGKGRTFSDDNRAYDAGQRALEGRRYTEALEYFNQVAGRKGDRADGALYWKAYTLVKLGRADEARATLADLRKSYASSRWLDDARALEVEAGKPVSPESESDEELKLLALNGLMQSDPDRAFPLLETLLKSAQPPRIKRNAVYVLAQSNSPKAQQLLEGVAKGQGNPDLQLVAIRYLGEKRRQGGSNPVLAEIYASSNDVNVKRAILQGFESARDKDRLLNIAKTEKNDDLRLHAIRLLGGMKEAQADMWSLYQSEQSPEIKQRILESIPSNGNLDKLLEVAKAEKDAKLRRFAINNLSTTRAANTGDQLAAMYAGEQDQGVKRAIVSALASQKNVKQLVQCARGEKDNGMQRMILEHLVSMKSPEANEYLMEIIKK
jgi:hypothetical protein